MQLTLEDFLTLREQLPVVDVRSQREFAAGRIQRAVNVPLLNDEERAIVGTTYKKSGQLQAIKEGFRLVGPRLVDLISETQEVAKGREILVHCWRGGMRSDNFARFAAMAGISSRTLVGGYKSYRGAAMASFKQPLQLISLAGCTGSGKSDILRRLALQGEQVLDLEGLANHKGSAFGGLGMPPQPTTEQFQNDLYEEILKLDRSRRVWVEDESIAIGKIFLPGDLWKQMTQSPLVQMDVAKDVRIARLVAEYGVADREEFLTLMTKITKKLGGQNFQAARMKLLEGDMASTIDILLTYYDKAYLESMEKRKDRTKSMVSWDGKDLEKIARELARHR